MEPTKHQGQPIPPETPETPCATLNPAKPFGKNLTRLIKEENTLFAVVMISGFCKSRTLWWCWCWCWCWWWWWWWWWWIMKWVVVVMMMVMTDIEEENNQWPKNNLRWLATCYSNLYRSTHPRRNSSKNPMAGFDQWCSSYSQSDFVERQAGLNSSNYMANYMPIMWKFLIAPHPQKNAMLEVHPWS